MSEEPDVDIINTINNFMIEAAVLLSALRGAAELQQQQILELQAVGRRLESLQSSIRDQAKQGVVVSITPALTRLEQTGAKVSEAVTQAANKATAAVTVSLLRVENTRVGGFWRVTGITALASLLTFTFMVGLLPWIETFMLSVRAQ